MPLMMAGREHKRQRKMRTIEPTNRFSVRRTAQLMRIGLRSKEFGVMVIAVAVMFVSTVLLNFSLHMMDSGSVWSGFDWRGFLMDVRGFSTFCILVSPTVGASLFAAALKERGDRVSHIMLPATNAEKFLARFVVVVGGAVAVAAVIYVAVYALVAIPALASGKAALSDISPFDFGNSATITVDGVYKPYYTFCLRLWLCAVGVYTVSAYFLGGMLWKGRSWLLTTVALVFLSVVAGIVVGSNPVFSVSYANDMTTEADVSAFAVYTSLALAALAALNVYITWRLFSRMQAVRPRFRVVPGLRRRKTSTP